MTKQQRLAALLTLVLGGVAVEEAIVVQPGETITLAGQTVTGTAAYVLGMLNTREDQ